MIPDSLLANANAVTRVNQTRIVVDGINKATIYVKKAITILNVRGDDFATFSEEYDKFINIESVEGTLFDANGNKIRTLKKIDLKDESISSANLMDDARIKEYDFQYEIYPYTVEYEYKLEIKGIIDFPEWAPMENEKLAVQSGELTVECPEDYQLRYKSFNYKGEPLVTIDKGGSKIYDWTIKNIPALNKQKYQPQWYEITPTVFLAPSDFEIASYKGNMNTWSGFGKFVYTLNQGRDQLPDDVKKTVHALTDNLTNDRDKIEALYKYLQKNTRYVSIQLGIGGWQTFDAAYVAKNGYGDCKALSNYMCSLLKEVNIKGYYTLIKAGENNTDFLPDFPSNQFDHIIVCVPVKQDTVWLECTSSTLPAGYLGGFTSNRDALLIDESGGRLIHTPDYIMNDNLQIRKINANVDSTGFLKADIETLYTGLQQDDLSDFIDALSKEKIMNFLKENVDLPTYDIESFHYDKKEKNNIPAIDESLAIIANNYASVSGRRIFIVPNILSRHYSRLKDFDHRMCDIILHDQYKDVDSVEISVPVNYAVESLPQNVKLISKFGIYSTYIKTLPGKIIYYRSYEQYNGRFPASDSKELSDYFEKIYKADRAKVVLVKNQ